MYGVVTEKELGKQWKYSCFREESDLSLPKFKA
jgi:hypothetical protein